MKHKPFDLELSFQRRSVDMLTMLSLLPLRLKNVLLHEAKWIKSCNF